MKTYSINKRANFDYKTLEKYTASIELWGFEVKSIRLGRSNLTNSYITIKNGEAFIINLNIPAYQVKNMPETYDALRPRKLLLKKSEIMELLGRVKQRGLSLIPLKIFSSGPRIKIELAVAQGLKKHDKRELIKKRETKREIRKITDN